MARPTVIMHTGFDGTAEEMHVQGAAAGAERSYNVLVFDGPGQGGTIRHQGMLFRPDWENVVGPVIDFALTLPGVDSERLALWGLSMGGLLAPRAARLRAPAGRAGGRRRKKAPKPTARSGRSASP